MMSISRRRVLVFAAAGSTLIAGHLSARAQTARQPTLVYADGLKNNWSTTGWARAQLETPLQDQKPIELFMAGWSNFGFRAPEPVRASDFATLTVLVHGGDTGGQSVRLQLKTGETVHRAVGLRIERGAWRRGDFSIQRHLGVDADASFDTIEVFNPTDSELAPWYLNYVLLQ